MGAAKEEKSFVEKIRVPRLDDAGLEDCALSPNSINQAFFKAANSIRSLVVADDCEGCVKDPDPADSIKPESPGSGGCKNHKGLIEVKVAGGGGEGHQLKVVAGVVEKSCVYGLRGLGIDSDDDKGKGVTER